MAKYKRLGYALSVAALLAGSGILMPEVFADGVTVTSYDELDVALCNGGEITIGADIEVNDWLATGCGWIINKNTTIDFNGHTVTSAEDKGYNIDFQDATLTFKDSVGGGGYTQLGTENIAIAITNGKFVLDGGTITANTWGVVLWHDSEFEMNGGVINAENLAISGNGTTDPEKANYGSNTKIVINDGELNSATDWAIYNPAENSTIDIYGGKIVGASGAIAANRGVINIYDGELRSLGTAEIEGNVSQDGTRGYENAVIGIPKEYGPVELYINGGTFINENGAEVIADVSGLDNENEAIVEVSGGVFAVEPEEEDLPEGYDAFLTEDGYVVASPDELEKENLEYYDEDEDGVYELMPIKVDWGPDNWGRIEDCDGADGHVCGWVDFGEEMIADRLATLSMVVKDDLDGLTLDESKGGELIGAIDIDMLDRNNEKIEVKNNSLLVTIEIDEDTYNELSAYDKLYMVYFDEDGVEEERFEINLEAETYEEYTWYYLSFETTHLSTYAVVGVNEEEEATEMTETPETGTVTAAGASAISASLVTAVVVGLLVTMMSFAYLVRK